MKKWKLSTYVIEKFSSKLEDFDMTDVEVELISRLLNQYKTSGEAIINETQASQIVAMSSRYFKKSWECNQAIVINLSQHNPVGKALFFSSKNLLTALQNYFKSKPQLIDTDKVWIIEDNGFSQATVIFEPFFNDKIHATSNDCYLAILVDLIRRYCDDQHISFKANFKHSPEVSRELYDRFFLGEVTFNTEFYSFSFPNILLGKVSPLYNENIIGAIGDITSYSLAAKEVQLGVAGEVYNIIVQMNQWRDVNIDNICQKMNLSRWTLNRKLNDEKTSFSEIVQKIKMNTACSLVSKGDQTMDEISLVLGYSSSAAFFNAFKKWTGKTPSEFKRSK